MTQSELDAIIRAHLRAGRDHVVPIPLPIEHPEFGVDYAPRGFVFNGSTGVPDWLLEAPGRHDWGYILGEINGHPVPKEWWDAMYRGVFEDAGERRGMRALKWLGFIRYHGMQTVPPTCWISKHVWNKARKAGLSREQVMELYVLPEPGKWMFPRQSWMLKDAVYMGELTAA